MKRPFAVLFTLILLFVCFAPAGADVIVEPENRFYTKHREECEHGEYRGYVSPDGAALYEEPYGVKVSECAPGSRFNMQWFYTADDGSIWGMDEGRELWIPMAGLELVYDHIQFQLDHAVEIRSNEKGKTFGEWFKDEEVCFYKYPGGEFLYTFSGLTREGCAPESLYEDASGRLWGYVGYFMGRHNAWVCISDPNNRDLSEKDGPALLPTGYTAPDFDAHKSSGTLWVAACAAIGIAIACTALLWGRRKKKARVK